MDYLMIFLAILATGTLNIACFFIGAKVGQKVSNGEEIKMPSLDPMKAIREHNDRKEAEREQDKIDAIMRNLECYNGTGQGQQEVPKG